MKVSEVKRFDQLLALHTNVLPHYLWWYCISVPLLFSNENLPKSFVM